MLAEESEGQFKCLIKNLKKKELENGKTITYKIKLVDSFKYISSLLSCLVDHLSEGLHNDKCTDYKS